MICNNKKTSYSLLQLTELIKIFKVKNVNNQHGVYSNESQLKSTVFAYIETKEPKTQIYDGMMRTDVTTHKVVIRWNPNLFSNINNLNRIGTGDSIIIQKSQEILEIISIYNQNSQNMFAIINCKNRGDSQNLQNVFVDTVN